MNKDGNRLLIQHKDNIVVNWGADTWGIYKSGSIGNVGISDRNKAIAFKEIPYEDSMTDFEQRFLDCIRRMENVEAEIKKGGTKEHTMTVGRINRYFVELIPDEDELKCFQYILTAEYYDMGHEWFPLQGGDRINVRLTEKNSARITCTVKSVVSRISGNRIITTGSQVERLDKDLASMAGKAMIQAQVVDKEEKVSEKDNTHHTYLRMRLGNIQLCGTFDTFWNPVEIIGNATAPGTSYMMCVTKPKDDTEETRPYFLSFTRMETAHYEKPPLDLADRDDNTVTGTVYKIGTDHRSLLWASFDDTWASCVFRNRMDLKTWGPTIRDFLPLGFPAQFALNLNVKEMKDRLFLKGFGMKLKGRVNNDYEAKNISDRSLNTKVQVMPHRIIPDEQRIMVTSHAYSGYSTFSEIPPALLRYCEKRIFSPEMKVPAWVKIKNSTVYFYINSALADELKRLKSCVGKKEKMKICSIHLGTAYLTTAGGYPVEYICSDEKEEELIRSKMFQTHEFTISETDDSEVRVIMEDNFADMLAKVKIPTGGFFKLRNIDKDKSGNWHTTLYDICCRILPESLDKGEEPKVGDSLMLVAKDLKRKGLIAVAHPERHTDLQPEVRRLNTMTEIIPGLWFCTDEDKPVLMYCTQNESSLIRHLCRLYGLSIPLDAKAVANPVEGHEAAKGIFCGIACGSDYTRLFTGQAMKLPIPITEKTPKVLFNDIVMTLPDGTDAGKGINYVIPSGYVSENGIMECIASATAKSKKKEQAENRSSGKGSVVRSTDNEVIFMMDGNEVSVPRDNLHLPYLKGIEIQDIFAHGSEWAIRLCDGEYHISTLCPDSISRYTLIKEYTMVMGRRRSLHDWIVKSSNGSIATAQILYGQEGDRLLMVCDTPGTENDDDRIRTVVEPDLIGCRIPVTLQSFGNGIMKCISAEGLAIGEEYMIREEYWNWHSLRLPYKDMSYLIGASFMASVMSIGNDTIYVDRRCLMDQCELMHGMTVNGTYQMKVAGMNSQGYILRQNGLKAILPWEEVSVCNVPEDDESRREFLKMDTQLMVEVYFDATEGRHKAKWRSNLKDTYERWKDYTRKNGLIAATVHHVGTRCLFLDVEGEFMYTTIHEIGLWEGDSLGQYFHPGQYLSDCRLSFDPAGNVFSISINDRYAALDTPQTGSVYDGYVLRYKDQDTADCYVKFGKWVATVPESEISWVPFRQGEHPLEPGTKVRVMVERVDTADKTITGSIRKATERPATVTELRNLTFGSADGDGNMIFTDEDMIPVLLTPDDYDIEYNELVQFAKSQVRIWLAVTGVTVHEGRLVMTGSHKVISESLSEISSRLESLGDGEIMKVTVKILSISNKRLTVTYGHAVGYIPQEECTGQIGLNLKEFYETGSEIECAVTGISQNTGTFNASIVKMYPNGRKDIFGKLKIGDVVQVMVYAGYPSGVRVNICTTKLFGLIPPDEINVGNHFEWAEKWKNDFVKVKCTDINYETGQILFSRKQFLGEDVEE
ncbi:MAG: hypothetical protein E7124_07860 [Bacteroidales bacterium]|nr:hypothetical protein [Bacteroidales bacterium]